MNRSHGANPPPEVAWQIGRRAATIQAVNEGKIGTSKAELDAFEAGLMWGVPDKKWVQGERDGEAILAPLPKPPAGYYRSSHTDGEED